MCKALTVHKAQGMSAGPGHPFESAIMHLTEEGERTNPGSELVATSRVTDVSFLAIYDTNRQGIMVSLEILEVVIVITKEKNSMKCYRLKIFSRQIVEENITKLDDVSQKEDKTFTGGCNFLLK